MALERQKVRIEGLHCIDCVENVEERISNLPGVKSISLSFATGSMEVEYDSRRISLEEIHRMIKRLGYGFLKEEVEGERIFSTSNREFVLALSSGAFLAIGLIILLTGQDFGLMDLGVTEIALSETLFIGAMIFGGYFPTRRMATAIANKTFVMDGLMVVGALGAVLIDAFAEGAAILFLFSLAELLEDYSVERTRDSLKSLVNLKPRTANVRRGGAFVPAKVETIIAGDIVRVRPGEHVSVDGIIRVGTSSIDQSPITGESLPVRKVVGDEVFAGTVNQEGRIEIEVTKESSDTMLSKIVQLVEAAADRKSKTARFIDRFAKYYTPAVLLMATVVTTVPTLLFGQAFEVWFYKALLLLLISCPCALAISTPVSMASSITSAARNGVLIKGGAYIERLEDIDMIAFDKTGTLTEGRLAVTDVMPFAGHSKEEVLRIASSLECLSEHPLGSAIVDAAKKEGIPLECIEEFKSIPGMGVKGMIGNEVFIVGTVRLFDMSSNLSAAETRASLESQGKTTVFVGTENEPIGIIALADRVRESAVDAVRRLRYGGEYELTMLTGDNAGVAANVAGELGVDDYRADLLPEEKVKAVEVMRKKGRSVAMVGDGVNDAPALAAADLGVAMAAAGSDTALEVADVALLSDDLTKVPYLLRLGKKTMRVVRTNIVVAIGVKLLFAILVFPGLVTLWMAVAIGDMGVSLGVILNALRLSRVR
jgi:Cd2+/Zn2+-exporting ATPase